MIEEIRILLGNASENFTDAQIGLNAKIALDFVETYTGCVIDYSLTLIAERICIVMLNRMNTEGLSSTSFNGSSESFINGLPDDIISALNKRRKVMFL